MVFPSKPTHFLSYFEKHIPNFHKLLPVSSSRDSLAICKHNNDNNHEIHKVLHNQEEKNPHDKGVENCRKASKNPLNGRQEETFSCMRSTLFPRMWQLVLGYTVKSKIDGRGFKEAWTRKGCSPLRIRAKVKSPIPSPLLLEVSQSPYCFLNPLFGWILYY